MCNMSQHTDTIACAIEEDVPSMLEYSIRRSLAMALPLAVCVAFFIALGLCYDVPVPYLDFDMYQLASLLATVTFVSRVIGQKAFDWIDGILFIAVYVAFAASCLQIY